MGWQINPGDHDIIGGTRPGVYGRKDPVSIEYRNWRARWRRQRCKGYGSARKALLIRILVNFSTIGIIQLIGFTKAGNPDAPIGECLQVDNGQAFGPALAHVSDLDDIRFLADREKSADIRL